MEKKPTTANIQAMNIKMKPKPNKIVSREPHQSKVADVANECSPDFCAIVLRVSLKRNAASMKNMKAIISPPKKTVIPIPKPAVSVKWELYLKPVAVPTPISMAVTATPAATKAIM